jgi:hypothetical protein
VSGFSLRADRSGRRGLGFGTDASICHPERSFFFDLSS